ncbi:MAG: hypothetical protein JJ892_01355 [Balneola sp.]|nr:hypothetical protein [Balneola sp.]MBO6710209.1 hypothetical protein [Balneola sp.]MBO6798894.1 hypothetical protein [Balneola sp.]MBO6870008.1 hypothetical protein [Balneola sp.]
MKACLYHIFLILTLILCLSPNKSNAQVNDAEAVELYPSFRHRSVINTVVISYYKDDQFYLPLVELFKTLQIDHTVNLSGNSIVINGKYLSEQTPYRIDLNNFTARFGTREIQLSPDDFLVGELDYYFSIAFYQRLFELDFEMDLNNLSLTLESVNTLPIVSQYLREQRRFRAQNNIFTDSKNYPVRFGRNKNFFNGGFLDYNISNSYNSDGTNSLSTSSTIGFELAGGDLQGSVIGNIATDYNNFETRNLRWRYVIRDNPLITNIQVGQTRSDGIISDSYKGIRITNNPIEPRRLFDEYRINGNTTPESEVELYLNNVLIGYEDADALGNYNFLVPLTYGNSNYDIRIFGPTGQVNEISKLIQIPFNFTPPGEINYHINAGQLDYRQIGSLNKDYLANGNLSIGLTNWLSAKVGAEYYESFDKPTYKSALSARLLSKYLITTEYASNAFIRSTANVVYDNSASIGATYTNFFSNSSLYNLSQDLSQFNISAFVPVNFFGLAGNFRISTFSRIRENLDNHRFKLDASIRKNRLSTRISYSDVYSGAFTPSDPTSLARIQNSYTYSIPRSNNIPNALKGSFLRAQFSYLPVTKRFEDAEFFVSRSFFEQGRIQFIYGRNFIGNFNSFGVNLVFDFNKVRSNSSVRSIRSVSTYTQNFRGSLGFDNTHNNFIFTSRSQVGRAATSFRLFVDNNSNGVFDEGDEKIDESAVRLDRAGAVSTSKDGVSYLTQLQPYYKYNMEIAKSSIKNPMLVPQIEKFGVITDPNQFKSIEIPFFMSGVIEGRVDRIVENGNTRGVSGLKLILNRTDGDFNQELRTFSEGSFYAYEVPPGNYTLSIDQSQLDILGVSAANEFLEFEVQAVSQGDFVDGLNFSLFPKGTEPVDPEPEVVTSETIIADISQSSEMINLKNQYEQNIDQTLRLIIQAQLAFYNRNIDQALTLVNESLSLFETAQGYALKGSLNYLKGNKVEAQKSWDLAVEFNPDIFIPDIEVLDQLIRTQLGN